MTAKGCGALVSEICISSKEINSLEQALLSLEYMRTVVELQYMTQTVHTAQQALWFLRERIDSIQVYEVVFSLEICMSLLRVFQDSVKVYSTPVYSTLQYTLIKYQHVPLSEKLKDSTYTV